MGNNTKGWVLTASLIGKHFGVFGEKLAGILASFDPETATEADRDNLSSTLREVAQKLAEARASFQKEHDDVVNLKNLISSDEKAFDVLAQRLEAGTISEATVNLFLDELESNKAKMDTEVLEEKDAKEYMDELQSIVDALTKQLQDFDANAKKALNALKQATAQRDLQEMRAERQQQLSDLGGLKTKSTALDALTRQAQKISNEAEGLRIIADINQKPLDQRAEIEQIRNSVASGAAATETALDRIKRLAGKAA